jgi:hypothetical protein
MMMMMMMMFKEVIAVCSENHARPTKQNSASLIAKANYTYFYHWALKGEPNYFH